MAERTAFLLRLDPRTMDAVRRWSADELRSVNGQIEFLLRRALRDAGRLPRPEPDREPMPEVRAGHNRMTAELEPAIAGRPGTVAR